MDLDAALARDSDYAVFGLFFIQIGGIDFCRAKSLIYRQLTYNILAKVDDLFSPSYSRLLPPSFTFVKCFSDPLHPISSKLGISNSKRLIS